MNGNLDMDWTENQGLSDSELMNIASSCGYDIMIGANNGEEIRRAYNTLPWPNDQEINSIKTDSTSNNSDTHEYVDLGLPSGTLWATTNIQDADGNELYFAWGETQGYTAEQVGTVKNFNWEDYEFGNNLSKYNESDGKTVLDAADDAATANWGSDWRMPTEEEFEELTENTITAWTQVDGVNGVLFTSKANTNTLFFPVIGKAASSEISSESYGFCWSASLDEDFYDAWILVFGDGYSGQDFNLRSNGCSVRPVRVSN
jgi:hypothetical protein